MKNNYIYIYIWSASILCLAVSCPIKLTPSLGDSQYLHELPEEYATLKKDAQVCSSTELNETATFNLQERSSRERCEGFIAEALQKKEATTLAYLLRLGAPITREQLCEDHQVLQEVFSSALRLGSEHAARKCLTAISYAQKSGETKKIFSNEEVIEKYPNALEDAIESEKESIVELILAHGFNVNYKNDDDLVALEIANDSGDEDIMKMLVSYGANPQLINDIRPDNHDLSPYIYRLLYTKNSRYYHRESVRTFLVNSHRGKVLISARLGRCKWNKIESLDNIPRDNKGYGLLMYAVLSDSPAAVSSVIDRYARCVTSSGRWCNIIITYHTYNHDTALDIAYKCLTRYPRFKNAEEIMEKLKFYFQRAATVNKNYIITHKTYNGNLKDGYYSRNHLRGKEYITRLEEAYRVTEYTSIEPWD